MGILLQLCILLLHSEFLLALHGNPLDGFSFTVTALQSRQDHGMSVCCAWHV